MPIQPPEKVLAQRGWSCSLLEKKKKIVGGPWDATEGERETASRSTSEGENLASHKAEASSKIQGGTGYGGVTGLR